MNIRRDSTKIILSVFITLILVFGARAANAAILYFSPSSGNFSAGNIFTVDIMVNTEGVAINNTEAVVNFPSGLLEVVSFSKSGSVFSLWVEEPTFSNSAGTLVFNGGLPTPGFNGANGKILSAVFRVKRAGSATVAFTSPAVRANDGYGTDVLRVGSQALYNLIAAEAREPLPTPTPVATPTPSLAPVTLKIGSPTHPDPSKWYSNNSPLFKWDVPSGVSEVILVLSRRATSVPFVNYSPPISERLLEDLGEGEWYLNARFRTAAGLGTVTSFKFNIDTQPPSTFGITRLDTADSTNPRPELLFESSDDTSGIDRYELTVSGGEAVEISPSEAGGSYAMPLQTPGEKDIEIKAIDRAGNVTAARLTTRVESIEIPRLERVSEKVREGERLIVEGTAKPSQKVLIYVIHENDNPVLKTINTLYAEHNGEHEKIYETTADASGRFVLEITDLPVDTYKIYAKAQDERGAISDLSNDMPTEVRGGLLDFIFSIFDWLVNVLSGKGLFIAFLVALVGLLLALVELIKVHAGKNIKKFLNWILVKMARKKSIQKVEHIIKDMQDELGYLKKIEKRRPLNTEEKYLKSKISSYLIMLKYIDKEIHNKD